MAFYINLKFSWFVDQEKTTFGTKRILIKVNTNCRFLKGLELNIEAFIPERIQFYFNWLTPDQTTYKDLESLRVDNIHTKSCVLNLFFPTEDSPISLSDTASDPRNRNRITNSISNDSSHLSSSSDSV